ncbi:MAG: 30S ribosomal protein S3 [Candidatus Thorarchaeota archaeon]
MGVVRYFVDRNRTRLLIDEYLARELSAAGYGGVEIRKLPMRTDVIIHASRPGVVIGRRGSKIRDLAETLETEYGVENAQVEVANIENPWLDARVMASRLARQLERGIRFRRMAYWILRRVIRAGALGCEIIVRGKLSSRRARYQKFRHATLAKAGEPALTLVDEATDFAILKPGVIGVKIRIMKPDAKMPGILTVTKSEKKAPRPELLAKHDEGEIEAPVEETEMAEVEEGLQGISSPDELRELEELDEFSFPEEDHELDTDEGGDN